MCVLTFVPDKSDGYILTNNRDENRNRTKAIPPKKYKVGNTTIYYPKDSKAGGTWIATNHKVTLCLLNGANEKHIQNGPYLKSRGQIILDYFSNENAGYFTKEHFIGIENFTLVFIENAAKRICQFIWDGATLDIQHLKWNQARIWSSSTLYSKEIREKRAQLFFEFLGKNPVPEYSQLIDFHHFADTGNPENNLVMEREDGTHTQCISQVFHIGSNIRFSYFDLVDSYHKSLIIFQ